MSVARGFTGYRGCYHVLDSRDRRATFSLVLDCVTCGFDFDGYSVYRGFV